MRARRGRPFIVDADVLIDYCKTDLSVLEDLSRYVVSVYIGRPTLDKVRQLSEAEAKRRQLVIVTPDLDTAIQAAGRRGNLAFDDHVTLLLSRLNSWCCITNDGLLRRECKNEGVAVLWGLEPMRILVGERCLKSQKAIAIAKLIQKANPGYITPEIVLRFEQQIKKASSLQR